MGIIKGLKAIDNYLEREEAKFSGNSSDAPKTRFFSMKDKQSFKIFFLQEMDADAKNYSAKNDIGFVATEHVHPDNFKVKALCTHDDEGDLRVSPCYGCEQHEKDYKAKWGQKSRLYINVLVDEGNGKDPYVAVLSQGNGGKSVTPAVREYAGLYKTLTDRWYQIKRNGAGLSDTSYLLIPLNEDKVDVESYELFDLMKVVRDVPYAEQAKFYGRADADAQSEAPQDRVPEPSAASAEW